MDMITTFRKWIETAESEREGVQRDILDFLGDQLKITNKEELLTMNTVDMAPDVVAKLQELGSINQIPNAKNAIKNGTNIEELIDIMMQHVPSSQFANRKHLGPTHSNPVVHSKAPEQQAPAQAGQ